MTNDACRVTLLKRASMLEYLTVGWNLMEGVIAVSAALASGSVALLGFGLDSFVESSSGLILLWRLGRERHADLSAEAVELLDRRAHKLVAVALFLLAAYVFMDSALTLYNAERPDVSIVGLVLIAVSIPLMWWLARAKVAAAAELGSGALKADSVQTSACLWLSITALAGIGLNGALGWWWADPSAALIIAGFIAREGAEAWKGEGCCCC